MSNTAIYCRVSTENQEREGTSLESQREACLDKARALEYDFPGELIFSETYSGLTLDRPQLSKLRERLAAGDVAAVIVLKPDRLSRVGEDILTLAKEFKRMSVRLIFVKEQWDDTPSGKMVAFALGWAGEMYVEAMKEATMRGKRKALANGKIPTGCGVGIYGYDWDKEKKRRVVNATESEIVKRIFNMIASGKSRIKTAQTLNKEGIPTKSRGLWHPA
jgi:site-specific DNA recombinase